MGVSTISNIVQETCEVIWDILQPIEMSEPTTNDWLDIASGYFEKTQFPNTVGAVSILDSFLYPPSKPFFLLKA